MINEKIEEMITETNWDFAKMLKLTELSEELAIKIYDNSLNSSDIIDLIWDEQCDFDGTVTFGEIYRTKTIEILKDKIMRAFQKHFETATVNFNTKPKEEPKPIIEKPKIKKPKSISEKQQDGTDLPKGLKRI